jgi:hypothetical protein
MARILLQKKIQFALSICLGVVYLDHVVVFSFLRNLCTVFHKGYLPPTVLEASVELRRTDMNQELNQELQLPLISSINNLHLSNHFFNRGFCGSKIISQFFLVVVE